MTNSTLEQEHTLPISGAKSQVADMQSALAVVVTHPWGVLGGDMDNTVVLSLTMWFQRLGATTLRFNFQGSQVGRGYIQTDQVVEAASFLLDGQHLRHQQTAVRPRYILLVGYSYGSIICGSASARTRNCIGVISIAPPFGVRHWLYCFTGDYHLQQAKTKARLRRLYVIGSNDNFTSEKLFTDILQGFPSDSTTGAVIKGADHFYHGRKKDLLDVIGQWLLSTYPQCGQHLHRLPNCDFALSDANRSDSGTFSNQSIVCSIFGDET